MKNSILTTHNLTKSYRHNIVVDNISLNLKRGEIYGLMGKNGAGKTTLIRLITALSNPDSGEISLFGETDSMGLNAMRSRIGTLVEEASFYPFFNAHNNLEYHRIQRGIVDPTIVDKVLKMVGLETTEKKKFKHFSLGMKQRLGLALAMMNQPDLLILDEPTNGLDPLGIVDIRNVLLKLNREQQVTILISSHILSELSNLATKYGFIHEGRLINEITASALEKHCREYLEIVTDEVQKAVVILETHFNCHQYEVLPNGVLRVYALLDQAPLLNKTLSQNGISLYSLTPKGSNLEDYFISMIGGSENA